MGTFTVYYFKGGRKLDEVSFPSHQEAWLSAKEFADRHPDYYANIKQGNTNVQTVR